MGNPLDEAWADFLLDKNPAWLKVLTRNACESPKHIAASETFGQNVQAFQEALSAFHMGAEGAFAELTQRLRKVSSTYRVHLAQLALLANPVKEYAVDALVVGTDLNGLAVTDTLLNSCHQYLEADPAQKFRLLSGGCVQAISSSQDDARLHGTLLVDVPFMGVSFGAQRAFFLSLQSPLDGIYFPSYGVVIRASALRFSCVDRLSKLFNWMLRNLDLYQAFWQQTATSQVRFLVRDKRPYHVLLDELSGRYELQESGITLPTVFFERASFIEGAETIGFTQPEHHVFDDLLVSNHHRADNDLFSKRYFHYLAQEVEQIYGPPEFATKGVIVWLSISGGEKRRWFEEGEALIAFIRWAQGRFGACHFYVDGWTGPLAKTASDEQQITQHKQIWEQVRQAVQLQPADFTLFIGASILRKLWAAAQAQFFISCAGTPSVWPSLIGRVPGVVHNSRSMIRRVQNTYYPDNVVRVPDEQIEDINEIGDKIRWDKYSYSIQVEDFLNCADKAYEYAFGCLKPEQFYKALVVARKSGNTGWLKSLEALCQERLATYRNLPHLLESSAFFGLPEIEILAEVEGNYRLIDCNVGCQSDVVFVTFGSVNSHVDHVPFGYPLLSRSGFKHLHVAQARKTSYQKLSFGCFAELLQPLVAGYGYRYTCESISGGKAALFYAPAICASAIANSAELPKQLQSRQLMDVLITARKSGNVQLVDTLESLYKERLASYRDLSQLLESSAFFGLPEVEILAEEEGSYRLIDCNVGCQSDVVFVTFGSVNSHVDHVPFGYPLLSRSGFKHLHVAQARKTSYQKLSFGCFAELLQPLVAGYGYRYTCESISGGKAALFYAPAICASAIANSAELPKQLQSRQLMNVLIAARKSCNAQLVDTLESLYTERLASYRNLPHLLKSSAFFGLPEVEILAEEEGSYRLIDCNVGCQSDVVFVTFGKVSSHVDHLPFGYPFLGRSGFKHLHMAQTRKTSYQKISFERFAELLQPLVAGNSHCFTYGTSLGGYAALYYAAAIGAHAIAGSPRLPLHPENEQFKGVHWQPGSIWDEAAYEHVALSRIDTSKCPQPFIIYDQADAIDSNFVQRCITPYLGGRFLDVPSSKHGSLNRLSKSGRLKDLILDYVASIRGS